MSELTARPTTGNALAAAAVTLATVAVVTYGLAVSVDDGFYVGCGIAGTAAFLAGRSARPRMEAGPARTLTLLATIVGALAGAVVILCTLVFAASYLV